MDQVLEKEVIPGVSAIDYQNYQILKLRRPESLGKALDAQKAEKKRGGSPGIV
jgi:hypothetical protein